MYETSKHANWLLVTLLLTLLISSLVLGWLLTRTSVFTSVPLLAATQTGTATTILEDSNNQSINIPTASTVSTPIARAAHASLNTPPSQAAPPPTKLAIESLSLLDSQQNLEQAAIIPKPILPLATLNASSIYPNLPRTTAPTALTTQSLSYTTSAEIARPLLAKTGWIYAGQFQNGNWSLLGLNISQTELPQANNAYKLVWGANVRSAPPGRMSSGTANLAENIGYLAEGSEIYVLTVKPSGKNGHIWLEISYGE